VAEGGAFRKTLRRPTRIGDAVGAISRRIGGRELSIDAVAPTTRSLVVALGILLAALCTWVLARETSLFAVRTVEVNGGSAQVAVQVRRALAGELDRSLLKIDTNAIAQRVELLPSVAHASVDRTFPHGLEVAIVPERGVALVRRGRDTWVISSRGRVIRTVAPSRRALSRLPRIWVTSSVEPVVGEIVEGELATAAHAVVVAADAGFRARVAKVVVSDDTLTLRLRSGLELLLGNPVDADLKLAVAARVMPRLTPGSVYLDVSVPERPVASTVPLPQVEDEGTETDIVSRSP
jgi:cell division protein FtsQ